MHQEAILPAVEEIPSSQARIIGETQRALPSMIDYGKKLWAHLHMPLLEAQSPRTITYIIPTSTHVTNYFGPAVYEALSQPDAPESEIEEGIESMVNLVRSRIHHSDSSYPVVTNHVKIVTMGVSVIANQELPDLLDPRTPDEKKAAKDIVLVTTIDQLLDSYYAHTLFSGLAFKNAFVGRGESYSVLRKQLAALSDGSRFHIWAENGRKATATVLPLPKENFEEPRFCLIGQNDTPLSSDLPSAKAFRAVQNQAHRIRIDVKDNQRELSLAFLRSLMPDRLIVVPIERNPYFEVHQHGFVTPVRGRPLPPRLTQGLELVVYNDYGNVDGMARKRDDFRRAKFNGFDTSMAIDVVQSGKGMHANVLEDYHQIVPLPCNLIKITIPTR